MTIVHISAECYPAAKAGGLGDVVGALPKYQNRGNNRALVCMPHYHTPWLLKAKKTLIDTATCHMGANELSYNVYEIKEPLGYSLYTFDIPAYTDRSGIYLDPTSGHGYWDEFERFLAVQIAVLDTLIRWDLQPDVLHCHDHHTALIPFMAQQCTAFKGLSSTPSIITVHNAEYHGNQDMGKRFLLPEFDGFNAGLLEWAGELNPLACGLKCAWKISTVSPSYMEELRVSSNGLEFLFNMEAGKSVGMLNGIDPEVWNPATDTYLDQHYTLKGSTKKASSKEHSNCLDVTEGKAYHKHALCREYELDPNRPLFAFIGRLVDQKGADLLASVIRGLREQGKELNFILLGTGDPRLEAEFRELDKEYVGYFNAKIAYNETLARRMYAGADFMVMPSRVEPCGLNQLYAIRYGTIPVVRSVGGLKDSVPDIANSGGLGIQFDSFSYEALEQAVLRASELYTNQDAMHSLRERIMLQDHSWQKVAKEYNELYIELQSYRD